MIKNFPSNYDPNLFSMVAAVAGAVLVGDFDDYETIELTYYKNGYVTDDQDILMSNDEVEEAIGWNNITRMGEYEEDALHVRNEKRKTDYEILQVFDDYRED